MFFKLSRFLLRWLQRNMLWPMYGLLWRMSWSMHKLVQWLCILTAFNYACY